MSRCLLRENGRLSTRLPATHPTDDILVRVNAPDENGVVHELDVTLYEPANVDVAAKLVVAAPPNWPVHAGWDGMAPGPMVMT
jgi:hypothetical protein